MTFRFLGTGTSVGVPQIGCDCKVCASKDPCDRRRRCGAYVTAADGTAFLIDTPPEMRLACCELGVRKVDAVVLTHAHMDHIAGFDDVRRFNTLNGERVPCDPDEPGANGRTFRIVGRPLNCYALPKTIEQMHVIFPYVGMAGGQNGLFRPQIGFVDNTEPFMIGSVRLQALAVEHGFPCCGYRLDETGGSGIGSLVYISDCHRLPEATVAASSGVDTLVIDCLRERPHPTHLNLEAALSYIGQIAPRRAFLTHLCHDFTHAEWLEKLAGTCVRPAYDGLLLEGGEADGRSDAAAAPGVSSDGRQA